MHDEARTSDPETPTGPGTGADGISGIALIGENASPAATESSGCTALTKSGQRCAKVIGVKLYPDGPRCSKHRPKLGVAEVRSPVRSIRTPEDALTLSSFAAVAAMEGKIPPSRANAIANISREWRRSYEAGKHGAAYDAAVRVVEELVTALAEPSVAGLVPRVMPAGSALDRAVRAYLATARRAVGAG